jgi:hypothetical protein
MKAAYKLAVAAGFILVFGCASREGDDLKYHEAERQLRGVIVGQDVDRGLCAGLLADLTNGKYGRYKIVKVIEVSRENKAYVVRMLTSAADGYEGGGGVLLSFSFVDQHFKLVHREGFD